MTGKMCSHDISCSEQPPSGQLLEILLVEDEAPHADLVRGVLLPYQNRFHLTVKSCVKSARQYLSVHSPDLVITDLVLPDGAGIELLSDKGSDRFPVVVMTSRGSEKVAVQAMKAGAIDYVVKNHATLTQMAFIADRALRQWDNMVKRKEAEEALRRARDELERRVQERTADLEKANSKLRTEVNKRKRAQEDLRQSRKRYKDLWSEAPVAYHTLDSKGIITQVNQTEIRLLGFSQNEMVGRPVFDFVAPGKQAEVRERFFQKLDDKRVFSQEVTVLLKKDATPVHVSMHHVLECGPDREVIGVRTAMVDITERKRAEQALMASEKRLRGLSSQLITSQETERKRIAQELHDGIGQSLTAIKFGIESVVHKACGQMAPGPLASLSSLVPMLQDTVEEVRRIVMNLRPSTLDDLGVLATLSWFCRQFQKVYSSIVVEERIAIKESQIPENLRTTIFRIVQEAMHNVARHSCATGVCLAVAKHDKRLAVSIADNGEGFDPGAVFCHKGMEHGFGISGMKERTEFLGGRFSLESKRGVGTTVRASWPL